MNKSHGFVTRAVWDALVGVLGRNSMVNISYWIDCFAYVAMLHGESITIAHFDTDLDDQTVDLFDQS